MPPCVWTFLSSLGNNEMFQSLFLLDVNRTEDDR
jgi:hypothetical protein